LREAAGRGARGVKFHPPVVHLAINDPSLEKFYGVAEALRLPVLYHTGPHGWHLNRYNPLLVDEVAQRHPKLPLIIEHLGGEAFVHETFAVMQNNPNVYGGLATCLPADAGWRVPASRVRELIREFGADRFVFGADFPYNTVETNRRAVEVLKGLDLPHADVSLIVSGNLERLNEGVVTS
ncbi:MAG: amidohydrolase family protein, partial [bacterium]